MQQDFVRFSDVRPADPARFTRPLVHRRSDRMLLLFVGFLGYEWVVSGLDKVLSGRFVSGMHANMMSAIQGSAYGFYGSLLQHLCLGHCILIGIAIEFAELFIGAVFLGLPMLAWRTGISPMIARFGFIASSVSALLSLNIFLYVGGHFFLSTSDPFDEGIPIDLMMFLMQAAMVVYFYRLRKQ